MNLTRVAISPSPAAAHGLAASASMNPKALLKNEKAARDFEALLLTPVLDSLQQTFAGDDKTTGASDYRHLATQALAQSIAARGGIGIARLVLRHLPPAGSEAG